jgi:hypothetical protein
MCARHKSYIIYRAQCNMKMQVPCVLNLFWISRWQQQSFIVAGPCPVTKNFKVKWPSFSTPSGKCLAASTYIVLPSCVGHSLPEETWMPSLGVQSFLPLYKVPVCISALAKHTKL